MNIACQIYFFEFHDFSFHECFKYLIIFTSLNFPNVSFHECFEHHIVFTSLNSVMFHSMKVSNTICHFHLKNPWLIVSYIYHHFLKYFTFNTTLHFFSYVKLFSAVIHYKWNSLTSHSQFLPVVLFITLLSVLKTISIICWILTDIAQNTP